MEFPDVVLWAIPWFIGCLVLEVAWGRRGGVRYLGKDAAASLSMGVGSLVVNGLSAGLIAGVFFAVHALAPVRLGYAWWVFALCFLLEDLAYYWFHRISHESRWFWASHVVHHSSRYYNLATALRQTWTGKLTLGIVFWLPLVAVGFPPEMVFLFTGISLLYQFWIHTEAIGRLGPLELVLNTPSHHRVHHAVNPRYLDANYGGVLIVWDRLFGTFVAERAEEPPVYGIVKNIDTYNPFRIAFHEWAAIVRDVASAQTWREAAGYLFGPPGWSADGSRRTTKTIKAEWEAALGGA
jgi:sterol desaturase/sphingolipid hydroxylase (fatty acid hydroxylase superfamily)